MTRIIKNLYWNIKLCGQCFNCSWNNIETPSWAIALIFTLKSKGRKITFRLSKWAIYEVSCGLIRSKWAINCNMRNEEKVLHSSRIQTKKFATTNQYGVSFLDIYWSKQSYLWSYEAYFPSKRWMRPEREFKPYFSLRKKEQQYYCKISLKCILFWAKKWWHFCSHFLSCYRCKSTFLLTQFSYYSCELSWGLNHLLFMYHASVV